ncbi:uncharacterized protein LTR77_010751 [Saxophila tyrrhenica]|uniref:Uncharacterized protein n=1 Tax=Saxophila tyrrhenica TaxID=1690608 RepID=A0AAV9NWD3_9PEZI|nr:hypothetical protein LTR77_010751 [Saxophila tyrrhenica]
MNGEEADTIEAVVEGRMKDRLLVSKFRGFEDQFLPFDQEHRLFGKRNYDLSMSLKRRHQTELPIEELSGGEDDMEDAENDGELQAGLAGDSRKTCRRSKPADGNRIPDAQVRTKAGEHTERPAGNVVPGAVNQIDEIASDDEAMDGVSDSSSVTFC